MKLSVILLLVSILFLTSGYSTTSDIRIDEIEQKFKKLLPNETVFTKVPRGLIISFDENLLFDGCNPNVNESSLKILDDIATVLKELPNYCVIENHITHNCGKNIKNWELSMIRSANITDYLLKHNKISPEQLFDIGFGEYMPFKEIEYIGNNRVDFVIINYEAKR